MAKKSAKGSGKPIPLPLQICAHQRGINHKEHKERKVFLLFLLCVLCVLCGKTKKCKHSAIPRIEINIE
jgi:hypothetical protein